MIAAIIKIQISPLLNKTIFDIILITLGTRGIADCPNIRPMNFGLLVGSQAQPSLAAG